MAKCFYTELNINSNDGERHKVSVERVCEIGESFISKALYVAFSKYKWVSELMHRD